MSAHLTLATRVQQALASGWPDEKITRLLGAPQRVIDEQRAVIQAAHDGSDDIHPSRHRGSR